MAGAKKKEKSPKNVTIFGRLSFPTFTAQQAFERSQSGQYKVADVDSAKPDFQLLVEQAQLDKLRSHIVDVFFPYCVEQSKAGEKRDVLTQDEVDELTAQITKVSKTPYNTPISPIHEKTAPLAPECVASVKVIGNAGTDIELKAIVNDEDELLIPEPDLLTFPVIRPIEKTKHKMYPGAYVGATLNLYAYHNGKPPGFSAGGSVAVFRMDGERFGGGVAVDEDEMFLDD